MAFLATTQTSHIPAKTSGNSIFSMLATYRQRRALARLDSAALKDIGLTCAEARAEANRPIWDLPR